MLGSNPRWKDLLKRVPETGEYLIKSFIHRHIQNKFFAEGALYIGIHASEESVLQQTEKDMAKLEPPKGKSIGPKKVWSSSCLTFTRLFYNQRLAVRHTAHNCLGASD